MVSNAVIAEVLKGLNFPADKKQCVDYAKKRNAPKEVIRQHGGRLACHRGGAQGRQDARPDTQIMASYTALPISFLLLTHP
jgi:hypothetical protein